MEASAAPRPASSGSRPHVSGRLLRLASDERLVEHIRRGSELAFEVAYDRYHRPVLGFCRHMLGDPAEAEDALQHTFMAAYRDLLASDKPIQLKPWLYTIARNRCLSVLRGRRERPVDEMEEVPTEHLSTEVQRREDLRDLLADLQDLPDDQRAALVLAEVGDVSHDQIAQVLGCQREKVKALVFQARSSLIASRTARDMPCEEIRLQLANLRGGSLRRNEIRRHLRTCAGCREFREQVADQRKALAVALPVIPAVGLKEAVLGGVFGGGGAAGAATAAGGAGAAAGGLATAGAASSGAAAIATKALIVLAVAGGGGAVGVTAMNNGDDAPAPAPVSTSATPDPTSGGDPSGTPAALPGVDPESERSGGTRARENDKNTPNGNRARRADERGKPSERAGKARGKGPENAPGQLKKAGRPGKDKGSDRADDRRAAALERRASARRRAAAKRRVEREQRPPRARPEATPRAQPTPKPKPTPRAQPTADPTVEPTPTPTPAEPTPTP